MSDVVVHFLELEDALNYGEWFEKRAAQYNVEVTYQVYIGPQDVYIILKSAVC